MNSKKKRSKVFLSNLLEEGNGFFNFFKGGHLQKSLGNPVFKKYSNKLF